MSTEQWDITELDLTGKRASAVIFEQDGASRYIEPFVAHGRELVRFCPDQPGTWNYRVLGDAGQLDEGTLECTPATADNHGPVVVAEPNRFGYADLTPFLPLGTRALGWHREDRGRQAATLHQLAEGPFTKITMNVMADGVSAPPTAAELDLLESAVRSLADLGIQTELVLFSPELLTGLGADWAGYLREVVARFAAFRTVSWCLALDPDRWDGATAPDEQFWDDALRLLAEVDHGRRLRTIRAGVGFDFGHRLITHCSLRHDQPRICSTLAARYRKPVIVDDLGMEGDADHLDGSRSAEDLVSDIWEATCRGGAASHGECYHNRWSSFGGELKGAAAERLAFLGSLIATAPPGLRYGSAAYDASTVEVPGEFYLQYLGAHRFRHRTFDLPTDATFRVEVIDTWNLTVEVVAEQVSGEYLLELPRRLYNAIRITRC